MEREIGRRSETYSLFDERLTETEDRLRDSLVSLRARGAPARSHEARVCVRDTHARGTHARQRFTRDFNSVHHRLVGPTYAIGKRRWSAVSHRISRGRVRLRPDASHLTGSKPFTYAFARISSRA